ncbi:MAG: hypothetical protein HYV41_04930 [Candidatus Magasanikbacteria bacterium]|nr:hypothetical protein [Candidatus Magasanikbacteria bacterium]
MQNFRHTILKITATAVLLVLLFFCHTSPTSANAMSDDDHKSTATPVANQMHVMPCCQTQIPVSDMMHDVTLTNFSQKDILNVLATAILIFSSLLFLKKYTTKQSSSIAYFTRVRRRFGSTRLFYFLVNFFRLGILHPKTW